MIRHIIVEGMDGTGKSTLVNQLLTGLPEFRAHTKAARSIEGPDLATLDKWVVEDTNTLDKQSPSIFDRHPLVSETVYGPIVRDGLPGLFNMPWWVDTMRARVALRCLLIICKPPVAVVGDNLNRDPEGQMPGVMEKAMPLYHEYLRVADQWPGAQIRYNYTKHKVETLRQAIRSIIPGGTK